MAYSRDGKKTRIAGRQLLNGIRKTDEIREEVSSQHVGFKEF